VTIYRVCGEISVSRSIGDPDYKSYIPGAKVDAFFIWPEGHDQVHELHTYSFYIAVTDTFKLLFPKFIRTFVLSIMIYKLRIVVITITDSKE
jgi:hypothetical protein